MSSRARLLMAPVGITMAPRAATASKALQKPMKGPNENAISARSCGPISAASKHELPGLDPPVPIVERIEHDQRPAASARRAVIADIAVDWKGQVGRVITAAAGLLQFVLERERQLIQLVQRRERQTDVGQFLGVKPIVRQDLAPGVR